ncbi:MAG: hypothetical protein S0880_28790 [Actinomycetota bacterium]|nr:hypothetical protein [Actinomycetota bacterium]
MTITSGAGTCDDCSIAAYGLINGLLIPATLVIGTIATIVVARRTRSRQRATEAAAIVGVLLFLANVALATLARVLEALGVN